LAELVCAVEDFFDFFLAWWDFEDFFFLVEVVGAVVVELSGAIVCPVPVVWAYVSTGNAAPATNVSNANAEISAFMRELLDQNNDAPFFLHSKGVQPNITAALVATPSRAYIITRFA
jgi:hypothetical protein